jgi:hypothetical protein
MGLEEGVKGRGVGCELSLCWRVAEAVEVVETNWISFLLITLFIFFLSSLSFFTAACVCEKSSSLTLLQK